MSNARKIALTALLEVDNNAAYSNLVLDKVLKNAKLLPHDRALTTALFYGVLDRRITIDYIISRFSTTPMRKIDPLTLNALRVAVFQIIYMDKIPVSAAINESVNLVKYSAERRNVSFTNAVLRNISRENITLPDNTTPEGICIYYSCPRSIVDGLIYDYGIENTVKILEYSLKAPAVTIRLNSTIDTDESICEKLLGEDIKTIPLDLPHAYNIEGNINLRESKAYGEGLFHIQDMASQRAISVLDPKPDERILDVCAAPGGKSFTMAELMDNKGSIVSLDIHEHRVELIKKGALRLGLHIIDAKCRDSSCLSDDLGEFDAVLCDVPCSGLGVIRRKPEIKYKPIEEFMELPIIQLSILKSAAERVKQGGRLLYSTCTLRHDENENVVRAFLDENKSFELINEHTFLPHIDNTDGFYCALLGKK